MSEDIPWNGDLDDLGGGPPVDIYDRLVPAISPENREGEQAFVINSDSPFEIGSRAMLDILKVDEIGIRPLQHSDPINELKRLKGQCLVCDEGRLWVWSRLKGWWEEFPEEPFKQQISEYDRMQHNHAKPRVIRMSPVKVEEAFAATKLRAGISGFFKEALPGFMTSDGAFLVRDGELTWDDRNPAHRIRRGFDFHLPNRWPGFESGNPWNWHASDSSEWANVAPNWFTFLNSCLPFNRCLESVEYLRCFLGVSMVGLAPKFQEGALLVGTMRGANGKSTFMQAARMFVPGGLVASTDPSGWRAEYNKTLLVGALLNVIDEVGDWRADVMSSVRAAITGNPIEIRNIGKDQYVIWPRAGWVIGANEMMELKGKGIAATWRRFRVIDFLEEIPKQKRVSEDALMRAFREELPYMIIWALQGLDRTLADKRLPAVASSDKYQELLQLEADDVRLWARWKGLSWDTTAGQVPAAELYKLYLNWHANDSQRNKQKPTSAIEFGRRMAASARAYENAKGIQPGVLVAPATKLKTTHYRIKIESGHENA